PAFVENRVVCDPHLLHAIEQLQKTARAPRTAKIHKQVVVYMYSGCRLAWSTVIVPAQQIQAAAHLAHDVMPEDDILNRGPRHGATLVAHGEQDGESILAVRPVVLQKIAFDKHSAGILELEDVLHRPRHASVSTLVFFPLQWLVEMISPHLDVGWHQLGNTGLCAAKHHIFTSSLQIVVDNRKGARTVPASDGLRIRANFLEVGKVRIDYGRMSGIQSHSPASSQHRIPVDVTPVEYEMMRKLLDTRFSVAKQYQIGEESPLAGHSGIATQDVGHRAQNVHGAAVTAAVRKDLYAHETIM